MRKQRQPAIWFVLLVGFACSPRSALLGSGEWDPQSIVAPPGPLDSIAADMSVPGDWKVRVEPEAFDILALEFMTDGGIVFRVEMMPPLVGLDPSYSAYDDSLNSDLSGTSELYWSVTSATPPRYCLYRMKEIGVFLSKPLEPGPIVMLIEVPCHQGWYTRMVVGEGQPVPGVLVRSLVAMRMDLANLVYGYRGTYWDGWISVSDLRSAVENRNEHGQ